MALAAGPEKQVGKLVIRNVGLMLSGDLAAPLLDADALVAEGGVITEVGRAKDIDIAGARITIDAKGCALAPGLIDNHVHTVFGDWTPRQNQLGWIEGCMHGGVTTMISAGEVHLPGRPRDPAGAKALAIVARKAFENFRPLGMRVIAGAVIPERGLTEAD
nr:Enamidase [Acetobacteraceae bacterium]